jgi:hypothetical protein
LLALGARPIFHISRIRLNTELNPICHMLTLLGAHHIIHVSGVKVNAICQTVRVGNRTVRVQNVCSYPAVLCLMY